VGGSEERGGNIKTRVDKLFRRKEGKMGEKGKLEIKRESWPKSLYLKKAGEFKDLVEESGDYAIILKDPPEPDNEKDYVLAVVDSLTAEPPPRVKFLMLQAEGDSRDIELIRMLLIRLESEEALPSDIDLRNCTYEYFKDSTSSKGVLVKIWG
jgi:hypothetical protein